MHLLLTPVLVADIVYFSKTFFKLSKTQTSVESTGPQLSRAEPAFCHCRASNAPLGLLQLLGFSALWLHHPTTACWHKPSRFYRDKQPHVHPCSVSLTSHNQLHFVCSVRACFISLPAWRGSDKVRQLWTERKGQKSPRDLLQGKRKISPALLFISMFFNC